MAAQSKAATQRRRLSLLLERNGELELALEATTELATERGERIQLLLDYFDQRFEEWGKERASMERTIFVMHKQVRGYERKIALKEVTPG